jgi:hypothetical protein
MWRIALALVCSLTAQSASAEGCGCPVGPTLATTDRNTFDVSLGWSQLNTGLTLAEEPWDFQQQLVVAGFGMRFHEDFTFRAHLGAVLGGSISTAEAPSRLHTFDPGFLVSATMVWRGVHQGDWPWVDLALTLGVTHFRTRHAEGPGLSKANFTGTDQRVGLTVGYTLFDRWSLYVSGRIFASPFWWDNEGIDTDGAGVDQNGWNAAIGTTVELPWDLTLYADWSPFGEQALTAGVAYRWRGKDAPARDERDPDLPDGEDWIDELPPVGDTPPLPDGVD